MEPPESPLHDPLLRQDLEALGLLVALDDLELSPSLLLAPLGELLATVGAVSPDLLQTRH